MTNKYHDTTFTRFSDEDGSGLKERKIRIAKFQPKRGTRSPLLSAGALTAVELK